MSRKYRPNDPPEAIKPSRATRRQKRSWRRPKKAGLADGGTA